MPAPTAQPKTRFLLPTLIDDYYVYKADFEGDPVFGDTSAVLELASGPPLNTPNCSARTVERVRMPSYTRGTWAVSVVFAVQIRNGLVGFHLHSRKKSCFFIAFNMKNFGNHSPKAAFKRTAVRSSASL
jgi:hypothetical protein